MPTLISYVDASGNRPFNDWLGKCDMRARERVLVALDRLSKGNTGALKSLGGGLFEVKISFGPGYRVYCAQFGSEIVLLLLGGSKRRQNADIEKARRYLRDAMDRRKETGK